MSSVLDKLPRWKCHKVVRAAKIISIDRVPNHDMWRVRFEGIDEPLSVAGRWVNKHAQDTPAGNIAELVCGYYVVYEDGYASWSPAGPFEKGYELVGATE